MSDESAAFHGLATNRALPIEERFGCALQALELYEAEVDAMRPVVEAARACIKAMELRVKERYEHWADSPWLTDESKALFAAVDALDGAS